MKSGKDGFTLLEMLIAMGLLAFVLAAFMVMISVAGQLIVDNRRDLQRAYTKLAVLEIVRSNPKTTTVPATETNPAVTYTGFFPTSWPDGSGLREIESILVQGTDLLSYSLGPDKEWKAEVEHVQRRVYANVLGRDVENDY